MGKRPSIGRAEAEVLRFIVDRSGATVTEVGEHLMETKGQTRNTALNMMERLRQKGFLDREKNPDGVYRYTASESKGRMFESFVEDFVDSVLGGSVAPIVAYLGNKAEVDEHQLEALRKLVKSLEDRDVS